LNQIDQIRAKIKISPNSLALSAIPISFRKCAVELGIGSKLFATDKGFYDGQAILALYHGASSKNSEIWIVEKSCERIVNLKD
jgi:hypothetical protein